MLSKNFSSRFSKDLNPLFFFFFCSCSTKLSVFSNAYTVHFVEILDFVAKFFEGCAKDCLYVFLNVCNIGITVDRYHIALTLPSPPRSMLTIVGDSDPTFPFFR